MWTLAIAVIVILVVVVAATVGKAVDGMDVDASHESERVILVASR